MNPFLNFLGLMLFHSATLVGQPILNQDFKFQTGAYYSFEEFQNNNPSYKGIEIEGNYFINRETRQAKVEYIRLKANGKLLDLDTMWGICIKGIPYIRVTPNLPAHHLKVFASLEVRGKICYYAYDDLNEKHIPFKAYNPVVGKPFRTVTLKRNIPIIREKMLHFETGAIADFNYKNLLEWVAAERSIKKALESMGPKEAEEKLFEALLLYNEKHPVNIK